MPLYNYRAKKSERGEIVEGLIDAETESIANNMLEDRGFTVLFLDKKRMSLSDFNVAFNFVSAKDLVILSRQLSILISAEVRLVEALHDIATQTSNPKLKEIVTEVGHQVSSGLKFSEALAQHPKTFSNYFINIIRSGEVSGRLQEVLLHLADQLEKDYDLKSKIKGAMYYPAFIVTGLIAIGIVMMVLVIPKMTEMLKQTGTELPLATRILMGTSDFMVSFWWLVVLLLVGAVVAMNLFYKTYSGKKIIDRMLLGSPVFGKLFTYIYVTRFCSGLKTLLLGGVDIIESLKISGTMVENTQFKEAIYSAVKTVEGGGSISLELERSKHIPKLVSQMLRTGEETGKMEDVLDKITAFYSREIDNTLKNLMSLLEPIIMVILGAAVFLMVAAIILPMMQISSGMAEGG